MLFQHSQLVFWPHFSLPLFQVLPKSLLIVHFYRYLWRVCHFFLSSYLRSLVLRAFSPYHVLFAPSFWAPRSCSLSLSSSSSSMKLLASSQPVFSPSSARINLLYLANHKAIDVLGPAYDVNLKDFIHFGVQPLPCPPVESSFCVATNDLRFTPSFPSRDWAPDWKSRFGRPF